MCFAAQGTKKSNKNISLFDIPVSWKAVFALRCGTAVQNLAEMDRANHSNTFHEARCFWKNSRVRCQASSAFSLS